MEDYIEEYEASAEIEITKADEDKRLVFGWASIAIENGEQLEDMQHDVIDPDDLEEAAYEYVLNFRDTGEEHLAAFRKKGKLVESCVFTEEKQQAMGLVPGTLPVGWWIGFYIEDDDAWERIKNGTYRMFSIEGKAERVPVDGESVTKSNGFDEIYEIDTIEEVEKFNPYHDRLGRFTTASGASSFTIRTRAGYNQGMADRSIERAKEKHGRQTVKEPATQQTKMSEGKDMSDSFTLDPDKGGALEQIAELQGFKNKGRVISSHKEFVDAVKKTGFVGFRTVSNGKDISTKKKKKAEDFVDEIKNDDNFSFNGGGSRFYGGGIYFAGAHSAKAGKVPSVKGQNEAIEDSIGYGYGPDSSKTFAVTLDPSAKVAKYSDVMNEFMSMPAKEQINFDFDVGAYAAAKGYDAMTAERGGNLTYDMVYNRSKLIFFDTTFNATTSKEDLFNPDYIGVSAFR